MSSIVHRVLRCLGLPVNGCFLQQLTESFDLSTESVDENCNGCTKAA